MRNIFVMVSLVAISLPVFGAEKVFNFNESLDKTPAGFRSVVGGEGKPGDWKVILEDAPSAFQTLTPQAAGNTSKKPVLAQLSEDLRDEHFPILIFDGDDYGDFTFTTKFKTVKGITEQMAGIAFRIQDATNYYVVRASSLGNTFRFYKVVNGVRGTIVGPEVRIEKNVWHEMTVECKGHEIKCKLDGKELFPALTDNTFTSGKIGFWTKSDSVSYFADAKITYLPREPLAQKLLNDAKKANPHARNMKIFAMTDKSKKPVVIASLKPEERGEAAGKLEESVMETGDTGFRKSKGFSIVTWPLRDRNGEPIGVLQVTLKSFPGEMQQSAVIRGVPILKQVQASILEAKDLTR